MGKCTRVKGAFKGTTRQTRLNVFDGLYLHPEERGVMHSVDGQKLRDVVNPVTGFCITAVTATFNDTGAVVRPARGTSGGGAPLPERDANGAWHDPETGLIYRLTDDGDAPLRVTRATKVSQNQMDDAPIRESMRRERPAKGTPRKRVDSPRRAVTGRISDDEIRAYLLRKIGFVPPLNTKVRQAARAAITKDATVLAYQRDVQRAGS